MVLDHGSKSFIANDFVEFCSNGSLMGTYIIVVKKIPRPQMGFGKCSTTTLMGMETEKISPT
jgi:hypothetical protein